jgi:hypothetical protein
MSAVTTLDQSDEGLQRVSDGHRVVPASITASGIASKLVDEWGGIWTQKTHNPPETERKREKILRPDLARSKPTTHKTKPQMAVKNLQMLQDHRL